MPDAMNNNNHLKAQYPPEQSVIQIDALNSPFTIALAVQSDLPAIVAIYNQSIMTKTSTADLQPVTVADRRAWFNEHLNNPQRPIYVAKNETGDVMAWGSFSDVKSRPAYHISSEVSIYVSAKFHHRRLASLLLQWMLERAPSMGIQNILALIFAHNRASISLFNKFGFEHWGTLPNVCDMGSFEADVVIMGKALSKTI